DAPAMPIPLPSVKGSTLQKVIEWLEHYKDKPILEQKEDDWDRDSTKIDQWDREFMAKCSENEIFKVMLAVRYLDVKELLEITDKTIANVLKACKGREGIRAKFGLKKDFTPEEQRQT
ncbi:hypothetical protein PENTCL1PPCAC_20794, partial [Pristionchus entomophagus]